MVVENAQHSVGAIAFDVESRYMQGRIDAQFDRHVVVKDLAKASKAMKMPLKLFDEPLSLFSIFDGHGGPKCSEHAAQNFHKKLVPRLAKISPGCARSLEKHIRNALNTSLVELDTDFLARHRTDRSGCCVQIALLVGTQLYIAALGSARAILCVEDDRSGMTWRCSAFNQPHVAKNEQELERVRVAGGTIVEVSPGVKHIAPADYEVRMKEYRMQCASGLGVGTSAPSTCRFTRSLGNRDLKKPYSGVVAEPEVHVVELGHQHRVLALFSDGIADVLADSEIAATLHYNSTDVKRGISEMVQDAYNRGGEDNLTAVVVHLKWSTCKKRVRNVCTQPPKPADDSCMGVEQSPAPVTTRSTKSAVDLKREAKLRRKEHPSTEPTGALHGFAIRETEGPLPDWEEHQRKLFLSNGPLFEDSDGDIAHAFYEEVLESNDGVALRAVVCSKMRQC
eukprot:TRINITY_DN24746_c0_g1_i1.p1 TRINITY_DN24746_c0_g1~~TRINITY_DN24746_c0_g1_i1.p1  ORF type:complete len:467 (-),score=44.21 TRINITY_DN24746_c0_g1_i1:105-1457(-)